jgi:hypothetical protein
MSIYSEQIQAIKDTLTNAPELSMVKGIYEGDFQVIGSYPAISIELTSRDKAVRGIGGLFEYTCTFNIWIYSNKPSYQQALDELETLVEGVEKALKDNGRLNGLLSVPGSTGNAQFGVSDRGGALLQAALIQYTTKKLGA